MTQGFFTLTILVAPSPPPPSPFPFPLLKTLVYTFYNRAIWKYFVKSLGRPKNDIDGAFGISVPLFLLPLQLMSQFFPNVIMYGICRWLWTYVSSQYDEIIINFGKNFDFEEVSCTFKVLRKQSSNLEAPDF